MGEMADWINENGELSELSGENLPFDYRQEGGWCMALTYMNNTGDDRIKCEPGKFKCCKDCATSIGREM